MKVRLINTNYNTASMNMAIDEALLISKKPVIRFYRWAPSALSLGYFQNIKDINIPYSKSQNIDIVRRITGGKTVLHDKELTYSIIMDETLMPKSIIDSYKLISKGILSALKQLKLNPEMNETVTKNSKSAICFNEPSYYEITVNNKKIVGSAQTRKNKKLLQHGSILIDLDYDKLVSTFNIKNKEENIKKTKARVTSINNELRKEISYNQLKEALISGFQDNLEIELVEDQLTKEELALANKLEKEKYSTKQWNINASTETI